MVSDECMEIILGLFLKNIGALYGTSNFQKDLHILE
jgi:hypothetical protein